VDAVSVHVALELLFDDLRGKEQSEFAEFRELTRFEAGGGARADRGLQQVRRQ